MAKRFTDTNKWDHSWIRRLSCKFKCALFYILDKCDHAGLWVADFEAMSFIIGETVTQHDFENHFKDKIILIKSDKYFIPSFIDFQYGSLNQDNRVHKSVILLLEKEGAYKHLKSSFQGAKDKDKEKDKDKAKDKKKDKDTFDFEFLYKIYPLKKGKSEGITRLKKFITSQEDFDSFKIAVKNYTRDIQARGTEAKYIKHFSSFVGNEKIQPWKDWLDADAGTAIAVTPKPLFNKATQRTENNRAVAEAYMKKLEAENEV